MSQSLPTFLSGRARRVKRVVGGWVAEPETLRHLVRENQPAQIFLSALLGLWVGLVTFIIHEVVMVGHDLSFGLPIGHHLSDADHIEPWRIIYVPVIGGLILGLVTLAMKKWRPGEIVDPIEANAVLGGRMSVIDSGRLVLQALISNVAGASVGMEAAYTQMGAGLCSWVGRYLHLRRDHMRILVASGAAAAIAAAFNAPLAGAFYGFELVLGTYTIAALPQVAVCALCGVLMLRCFGSGEPLFSLPLSITTIPAWDFPLFVVVGVIAAQVGILTMKAVTKCEQLSRAIQMPVWMRPAVGGALMAAMALIFPQVLGSGQGAINNHLHNQWPLVFLALLLGAKILASAVSIGWGFRGGLFSSSLLLGCLFGQLAGIVTGAILPDTEGQVETFMLVGMGAVGTSIVGAPVTMVLLVLEMTANYPATIAVMIGVLVASVVTRYSFGYSFSTWRFHLRGLRIAGAHDIGWISDLTVESMMQQSPATYAYDMPISELRQLVPATAAKRICLVDGNGFYKGIIDVADLHSHDLDSAAAETKAIDLAKGRTFHLLPLQDIRQALDTFTASQVEELPVVQSESNMRIIGSMSEPYTLKRYARELEARNIAQSGAGAPVVAG